jgi:alpha-ketoglutarate-dependent taurine dioxygenase
MATRSFHTTAQTDAQTASQTPPKTGPSHKKKPKQSPPPPNTCSTEAGVVEWNSNQVRIRYADGESNEAVAPSPLWLRDSCPCRLCVDPDSGQKNFSTTDLPHRPPIERAKLNPDRSLEIFWTNDAPSGGAPHISVFPAEEVAAWQNDATWQRTRVVGHAPDSIPWDRAAYEALLADGRCRVSYQDWMSDEPAFWDALLDLRRTGLIFVTGVPSDEGEVERIARRIGPLQDTFYGRTWDVKSKPRAENVAYTSKFLGLHQDLLYHDPVPGLQLLHCLANSCAGGESLFSHGVRAAHELRLTALSLYDRLTKHRVMFGYRKGEHHYLSARNTISTTPSGYPKSTAWAPPFQATFKPASTEARRNNMVRWKFAATAFQRIAESETNMLEVKLKEGECVIFDNRQILHGRRQFAAGGGNGDDGGSRWLKGAYISHQNYAAAATRLAERREAAGLEQPSYMLENVEREELFVKASLQARGSAAAWSGEGSIERDS